MIGVGIIKDYVYKILIIILIISIIVASGVLYLNEIKNVYYITLNGEENINIYVNDQFNDPGFIATDKKGNDVKDLVIVDSNIDVSKIGTYTINYYIKSFLNNYKVSRIVNVIEKPFSSITFSLLGQQSINLNLNEIYEEPGFICQEKDTDCKSKVTIDSNLDNTKIGSYKITYTLIIGNEKKDITREVSVEGPHYNVLLDNNSLTNQDVTINFTSNIANLDYIETPKQEQIKKETITYKVTSNGDYTFTMCTKDRKCEKALITISNIDKTPPTASCNAYIGRNRTRYDINANDNQSIKKYVAKYDKSEYKTPSFTINSYIMDNAIIVYDEANNYAEVKCHSEYMPIEKNSSNNLQYEEYTDTLKFWIEKVSNTNHNPFYVSHIWVKDAYNQMKTAVPPNFGKELSIPKNILNNAMNKLGYKNKLIIGSNGSGFILKDNFSHWLYLTNNAWNMTSASPVVIVDGKILRDLTPSNIASSPITYGLKKDGYLGYYRFSTGTNLPNNLNTVKKIVDDGVKYTLSFQPVLVSNNKVVTTDDSQNVRQALCQIDLNNFVLITDIYQSNRKGFTIKGLAEYMVNLGCYTGFNLDGGGSTQLMYKSKNSTTINNLTSTSRSVADILYFVEK